MEENYFDFNYNAEQQMLEEDAAILANKVNEQLNQNFKELVMTQRWDDSAISDLESTIKNILHTQFGEYRDTIIRGVLQKISSNIHGVDILQPLMDNPDVTEIEVVAYDRIYFVDFMGRKLSDIRFDSEVALKRFVTRLVDRSGSILAPETPIVDFALPNRTRVNVVGEWATVKKSPYITMRKPPSAVRAVTESELLEWGAFTTEMNELMQLNSDGKMNILLSGETNSGKTTIIRMLMDKLNPDKMERILLLQDTPEIDPVETDKIMVLLQTINRKNQPVTFFDLLKSTLRMNPDRTWIGEIRGLEAAEMIESNLAGARGTIASGHADSPQNMVMRLVILMYRAGFNFGEHTIRQIIHNSLDFIYQTAVLPDGSKKIVEVAEVLPLDVAKSMGNETGLNTIFEYRINEVQRNENGVPTKIIGKHAQVNPISEYRRRKFMKSGILVPDSLGGVPTWK